MGSKPRSVANATLVAGMIAGIQAAKNRLDEIKSRPDDAETNGGRGFATEPQLMELSVDMVG